MKSIIAIALVGFGVQHEAARFLRDELICSMTASAKACNARWRLNKLTIGGSRIDVDDVDVAAGPPAVAHPVEVEMCAVRRRTGVHRAISGEAVAPS
jgi:hypothetical protein